MSHPSHYEITVTERIGKSERFTFLFRTDEIQSHIDYTKTLSVLKERFPGPDYRITGTYWDCSGRDI